MEEHCYCDGRVGDVTERSSLRWTTEIRAKGKFKSSREISLPIFDKMGSAEIRSLI